MKFENIKVYNFENALRGMRNPKNSWNLSDSYFGLINIDDDEHDYEVAEEWVQKKFPNYPSDADNEALMAQEEYDRWLLNNGILEINFDHQLANVAFIGPNDMKLAKALAEYDMFTCKAKISKTEIKANAKENHTMPVFAKLVDNQTLTIK